MEYAPSTIMQKNNSSNARNYGFRIPEVRKTKILAKLGVDAFIGNRWSFWCWTLLGKIMMSFVPQLKGVLFKMQIAHHDGN